MDGWISVKDRLPPDNERVLIGWDFTPWDWMGRVYEARYRIWPGGEKAIWYRDGGAFPVGEAKSPTHWMPLPAPPGGGA